MNKLDALKSIAEGINALIDLEIGNAIPVSEEPKQEDELKKSEVASLAEKKAEKKVEEKEEVAEEVDVDSMDYRQLKSYAAEIGVKAKGTKGQLLKAVKDFLANGGEDAEEEVEEKPSKKPARGVASMKAKRKAEEEEEPEEDDSESEEEDTTIARNTEKEVERAIEEQELTDDDLRDILKDLGLSTKGGHEVLVSKLADAVDAGELSLDDDEVEEETDEAEETESEKEDVEDEEKDAEEDGEETEITAERKQAVDDFTAETTEAFENEELSVEDMRDFIKDFGEKISKKASDKEVLAKYIECASMLIDDEGNTVEEGAYMLNGVPFCCGHALEISEDETSGKCSICGEEYEFEE